MLYSAYSDSYRLYTTEINNGLFVIDFKKAHVSDPEITILGTSFIDMNKLLAKYDLHMPSDAIFLGVTLVKSINLPKSDS